MSRSLKFSKRLWPVAAVLAVLGALSLANWAERGRFGVPEDGVMWTDTEGGVTAARVTSESPAAQVGVRPGDVLRSIDGQTVEDALDATRILFAAGSWTRLEYRIERDSTPIQYSVVTSESSGRSVIGGFLLVLGWAYGAMGLLVWWRGGRGRAAVRFTAFCIASMAVYALGATGEFDPFDRGIYWLDVWALLLMPPLFLDFCAHFSVRTGRLTALLQTAYGLAVAVGAAQHAAAGGWIGDGLGADPLSRFFETAPLVLLAANLLGASWVVHSAVRTAKNPLRRLQAKWIAGGTVAAVVPFAVLYVIPFLAGLAPGANQAFSVFSLLALPACVGVATLRYRLFDLAWISRQAVAATAASGILVLGSYLALFRDAGDASWLTRFGPLVWLGSLALAAALYRPLRNWFVEALERRAYRGRYEERRTLSAFATELASEKDPQLMISAAADRLAHTFDVGRVAVLVPGADDDPRLQVLHLSGQGAVRPSEPFAIPPALSEVEADRSWIVLDAASDKDSSAVAERLGCVHFVPCRVHGRIAAWIGLGLTRTADLLGSDDLSLVETLAGPFGIALENARLYASLRARATEYQILKDYNENIVESLSVGIAVLDIDGRVRSWNTHLELSLHIARDAAAGRKLRELLPRRLVDDFEACQDDGGTGQAYRCRLRASEFPVEFRSEEADQNGERIVNLAVAPLVSRDFQPIGRLLMLDDVTDRIEAEERIVHADKLSSLGLLAAGVAHEVNTPLAVISSYSQMLAERFSKDSTESAMLGKVTEQTFRASEIVNSLLDFSRTSSPAMEPCDLNNAIEGSLELVRRQLQRSSIVVERDLCADPVIRASRGKLQQIFLNLFLNARDAMPTGGSLRIASRIVGTSHDTPSVQVSVTDSGVGMNAETLRQIFGPFYTTKEPGRGTGLGLAVTYGIVGEHSGTITAESKLGAGTSIIVTFPLAKQPTHV